MNAVRRCSHLLVFACIVSRIAARVPCGAHQNVDGLGGGANQPNVITQSVTWSASKKGLTARPTTTIETDCPTEDLIIDGPEKTMRLVHPSRPKCRVDCPECELDSRLRRLVEILDNLQAREGDGGTCTRRVRSSRTRRRPGRNYARCVDSYEDEDYPERTEYQYSVEEEPERRRRPRRRLQRICECEEPDDDEPPVPPRKRVPMVPKMDWLVLKKVPKKSCRRWTREDDTSDETGPRDILYIPPCNAKDKYRKRTDLEYDR